MHENRLASLNYTFYIIAKDVLEIISVLQLLISVAYGNDFPAISLKLALSHCSTSQLNKPVIYLKCHIDQSDR